MDKQCMVDFLTELGAFDKELLADVVLEGQKQSLNGRIKMQPIYATLAIQKGLTPREVEYRVTNTVQTMRYRGNREKIAETFGCRDQRIYVTPLKFVRVMIKKFA